MDRGDYLSELRQFREALKRMGLRWKDGAGPNGTQILHIGATRYEFDSRGDFVAVVTPQQTRSCIVRRGGI